MRIGPLPLTLVQDKQPVIHVAICPLAEAVCFLLILCRAALFFFWVGCCLFFIVCCACSRVSSLLFVLLSFAACFVCFLSLFVLFSLSCRGQDLDVVAPPVAPTLVLLPSLRASVRWSHYPLAGHARHAGARGHVTLRPEYSISCCVMSHVFDL